MKKIIAIFLYCLTISLNTLTSETHQLQTDKSFLLSGIIGCLGIGAPIGSCIGYNLAKNCIKDFNPYNRNHMKTAGYAGVSGGAALSMTSVVAFNIYLHGLPSCDQDPCFYVTHSAALSAAACPFIIPDLVQTIFERYNLHQLSKKFDDYEKDKAPVIVIE
ncbi:MAG TPA: hypothetical protein VLG50_03320 [Candidatus Saccharimonadales bacterium]|nr:hypothetical protein [Candidatus Saccharimonadales bacterium]